MHDRHSETGAQVIRHAELMLDIAGHFEILSAIAHEEWISEKSVTLSEIEAVFPMCGLLIEGYAKASAQNKARILKIISEEIAR